MRYSFGRLWAAVLCRLRSAGAGTGWAKVGALLIGGCAAIACGSPSQRRATLAFFFDGVPEAGQVAVPSATGRCQAHKALVKNASPVPVEVDPRAHAPFRDGRCKDCHDRLQPPPKASADLCFHCHNSKALVPEEAHAPVANGDCSACHLPHTGPNPKLLKSKPQALCVTCHDLGDAASEVRHKKLGETRNCPDCHLAHGGGGPSFLKPPSASVCGRCHELAFYKLSFQHSPAEGGECYECHTKHGSGKKHLLSTDGQQLCFGCHDEADLKARTSHPKAAANSCVKCHDPHGTGRRYLLRTGPTPATALPTGATPTAAGGRK